MSQKDRERLKVLHEVKKRHITQEQAGKELGISRTLGAGVVAADESAGRPGGGARVAGEAVEPAAAGSHESAGGGAVCQQKQARQWHDYGPTLAAEELAEHGLQVGKETLRKWLRKRACGRRGGHGWNGCTCGAGDEHAGASCCSGTPVRTTGWKGAVQRCI